MPQKCMDFLSAKRRGQPPTNIVVFGDEDFLRRQALDAVRHWLLPKEDDEIAFSSHSGEQSPLATIVDELATRSFFGDPRVVLVEAADAFISQHRKSLERIVEKSTSSGVLILEAVAWPSNTNLFKLVEEHGLAIDCGSPKPWHVAAWCSNWSKARYGKALDSDAAGWLVELVGTSLGQLDQEISKLASFVGDNKSIDAAAVDRLVAGSRVETAFKLLDLVLETKIGQAMEYLDRQLLAGESPVGILAMITAQLRRLTRAARDTELGHSTPDALRRAGIPPFAIEKSRAQLNHFGRDRMNAMYRRLLRADLDLKGGSGLPQRAILERLFLDLARPKQSGSPSVVGA